MLVGDKTGTNTCAGRRTFSGCGLNGCETRPVIGWTWRTIDISDVFVVGGASHAVHGLEMSSCGDWRYRFCMKGKLMVDVSCCWKGPRSLFSR